MSSSIQGPGITPPPLSPRRTGASTQVGAGFSRSISITNPQPQIPQGSTPSGKPLIARSISLPTVNNQKIENDVLTAQGLKNIAGDPKEGLFKKSPDYRALISSVEKFEQLPSNASVDDKQAILSEIKDKAFKFQQKKQGDLNKLKPTDSKYDSLNARVQGATQLLARVEHELSLLSLFSSQPQSSAEIIDKLPLYKEAGDEGHALLQQHLESVPPKTTNEFTELLQYYDDKELLMEHYHGINDLGKGRAVMYEAKENSPLQRQASSDWAANKISRTYENKALPSNPKELNDELNRFGAIKGLPANAQEAVISALISVAAPQVADTILQGGSETHVSLDQLHSSLNSVENINELHNTEALSVIKERLIEGGIDPESTVIQDINLAINGPISPDKLKEIGNALTTGIESLPDELNTVIEKPPRAAHQAHSSLKKLDKTSQNNAMNDKAFIATARPRYSKQNALYCNKDTMVQLNGKHIYHANHVHLPSGHFIAAQGPQDSNVQNYWAMLANENSPVSIDLTQDKDAVKNKIIVYTPPVGEGIDYGNGIIVKNLSETTIANGRYTVQNLEVNGKPHTRIHMNVFEDHTPGKPADLAALSVLARKLSPDTTKPIAVHCSAGVGRTNTFLAVANIMGQASNGQKSDLIGTVNQLRESRGNMVVESPGQLYTAMRADEHAPQMLKAFAPAIGVK